MNNMFNQYQFIFFEFLIIFISNQKFLFSLNINLDYIH